MIESTLPVIDYKVCITCEACVDICPDRVFRRSEHGEVEVTGESCMGCGHCHSVCPVDAISVPLLSGLLGLRTIDEDIPVDQSGSITPESLVRLMKYRRSCRLYKKDQVDLAILTDLVRIGSTAPSATNSQAWQFVVLPQRSDVLALGQVTADFYRKLNGKAANPFYRFLARICAGDVLGRYYRNYHHTVERALTEWCDNGVDRLFHGAPSCIVIVNDKRASCPAEDSLLVTQNILLAAETMGLATCLIGFVVEAAKRDQSIASLLRLGSHEQIYSVIACGYPDVVFKRPAGRKKIKPRIIRLSKDSKMAQNRQKIDNGTPVEKKISVVLYSFGFKHGVPVDANMVWDVRFLPNPYWQEELRPLSGCDQEIADFVLKSDQGKKFLELLTPLLVFLLDSNSQLDKKNLRIAIGCTGGRHRSVAVVEALGRFLLERDVDMNVFHRDMERD